jgi:hypothetical protein
VFLSRNSTNVNAGVYICMSTHPYEHIYAYPIFMGTFERLSRLDF